MAEAHLTHTSLKSRPSCVRAPERIQPGPLCDGQDFSEGEELVRGGRGLKKGSSPIVVQWPGNVDSRYQTFAVPSRKLAMWETGFARNVHISDLHATFEFRLRHIRV